MGRLAEADSGFRRMLARPDRNDQARGHRSLAYLDMLRGRYRSAIEHLTEAAVLSRATGAMLSLMRNEVLLAEAHLVRDQPALASRELDAALEVARSQYVEPGFLALLGRVLVRAGRTGDARDLLARVEGALKPENLTDRSARGLLVAELALARGAPEAAWEAIRTDIDPELGVWRSALISRTLEGRGVLDSALAAAARFSSISGFGGDTQADWVMAPLQVARIAEALGDSATARAALQALLDRWKDGDPDLRILRATRAHLARLQREAGR
jgi:tetratricopeptide (TPR) repeat protein